MGTNANDYATQWHANQDDLLESYESRAARQKLYDGEQMKLVFSKQDASSGSSKIDVGQMSKYDQDRRWRGQEHDENGRTVMAKTTENAYFREIPRSYTPSTLNRVKKFSSSNVERIRIASERNRRLYPKSLPLNNDDLLSVYCVIFLLSP